MDESSNLEFPHVRRELMVYLTQLAADDPRLVWKQERQNGLCMDIDEVFHFFFDDHDFDDSAVGAYFVNLSEVAAIETVKGALQAILDDIGDQGDDEFVQHPLWCNVTHAARAAQTQLSAIA